MNTAYYVIAQFALVLSNAVPQPTRIIIKVNGEQQKLLVGGIPLPPEKAIEATKKAYDAFPLLMAPGVKKDIQLLSLGKEGSRKLEAFLAQYPPDFVERFLVNLNSA